MVVLTKYAMTVNEQVNPNTAERTHWSNQQYAVGKPDGKWASAECTKTKYVVKSEKVTDKKTGKTKTKKTYGYKYNHPYIVSAHNFQITEKELPSNAYINSIQFVAKMKCDANVKSKFPNGLFCIYGSSAKKHFDESKSGTNSYVNGLFKIFSSVNLSSKWIEGTYTMNRSNFEKGGFTIDDIRDSVMGIDLQPHDASFDGATSNSGQIHLAHVLVNIDYVLPNHKITFSLGGEASSNLSNSNLSNVYSGNSINVTKFDTTAPSLIFAGETFKLRIYHTNNSKANDGVQLLNIKIPSTMELVKSSEFLTDSNRADTKIWKVNTANSKNYVDLTLKPLVGGDHEITVGNDVVGYSKEVITANISATNNFEDMTAVGYTELHVNHQGCLNVKAKGVSQKPVVGYVVTLDDAELNSIEFNRELSSAGVSLLDDVEISGTDANRTILLNVPLDTQYVASFDVCITPKSEDINVEITSSNTKPSEPSSDTDKNVIDKDVIVAPPLTYYVNSDGLNNSNHFILQGKNINLSTHRISTQLETGAFVFPVTVKESDSYMVDTSCALNINYYEETDYIGCVPLEHLHFDPKSTFKDTLLNNNFKNKRYMGKKLAPDEDISLNVRLHPHQVTTIQGLIKMDKPIPINANHRCFEGDALNHRGWAEIYGIKTEETNPHWYKCEIDVKYLTHNLDTRLEIIKGSKTNNYDLPTLLTDSFSSGDELPSGDNTGDYFKTVTDGTYIYDDDANNEVANLFNLDNNQYFNISTVNPLSNVSQINVNWLTSKLAENKENKIIRLFRLYDDEGSVFEYEYSNVVFNEDTVTVKIIGRARANNGVIAKIFEEEIELRSELDVFDGSIDEDEDTDDTVYEVDEEGNIIESNDDILYGSLLHFQLNNNKLSIIDEGYNGSEFRKDNIELPANSSYKWDANWRNNNTDGEDDDVTCFIDIQAQDTILTSNYADKFGKLYVSPFPCADKKILFTRKAEEGTLYYMEDDGTEFTFLINPYYVYQNGTDLVDSEGGSIFDLDYGYKIVYIQNGLVRLGFNRINGQLYLGKYDPKSKVYITTNRLQLNKYDDINVNSISDDKIEIQASDSIFSIWRGHPYIEVKHPTESINIKDNIVGVWAEGVGENTEQYPTYFTLQNDKNLLPGCIGGTNTIRSTCLSVDEPDKSSVLTETSLEWNNIPTITYGDEISFNYTKKNIPSNATIHLLLDGMIVEELTNTSFTKVFEEYGNHKIQLVYEGDDTHEYCYSKPIVFVFENQSNSSSGNGANTKETDSGNYKLAFTNKNLSTVEYNDNTEIQFRLTKNGQGVSGKTIERVTPNHIYSKDTDSKGYVSFFNKEYPVGKYKIGAYFYDLQDEDKDGKTLYSTYKWINIVKRTPYFNLYRNNVSYDNQIFKKGDILKIKLKSDKDTVIPNASIIIYRGGKATKYTTNKYGNVNIKMDKLGMYKYKVVYAGDKNHKKTSKSFNVKVTS